MTTHTYITKKITFVIHSFCIPAHSFKHKVDCFILLRFPVIDRFREITLAPLPDPRSIWYTRTGNDGNLTAGVARSFTLDMVRVARA